MKKTGLALFVLVVAIAISPAFAGGEERYPNGTRWQMWQMWENPYPNGTRWDPTYRSEPYYGYPYPRVGITIVVPLPLPRIFSPPLPRPHPHQW